MPLSRRTVMTGGGIACAAALFGAGHAAGTYRASIAAATARVAQNSSSCPTRSGVMEYAVAGRGAPLLMVHGTGGGFDQGLRFGKGLISHGIQVIAPSRFGYLGSALPVDPTPQAQADAFVDLLDHMGIDRLPVAGGSAGALSAAFLARRHPDRCSHLILLVPAMNLENRDPVAFTRLQRYAVERLLTSDRWFWAAQNFAPEALIGTLLATDPALLATVPEPERERAFLILKELMPISRRSLGIAIDGRYSGSPTDIDLSGLTVPTLVISAEDDRFDTARTARTIAARTPQAELLVFPTGGHIWLGHDADVAGRIAEFVQTATR